MYRLVLYGLSVLVVYATAVSAFGYLPYTLFELGSSLGILVGFSALGNAFFAKLFKAPVNTESLYITAFILFFILFPAQTFVEYVVLMSAGVLAMGSKYLIALKKKHLINPVAAALVILGLLGSGEAIWWVGSQVMLPGVLVLGFLVMRKLKRYMLVGSFLAASLLVTISSSFFGDATSFQELLQSLLVSGPLFFFAVIMLTEPLTTPPSQKTQGIYGALTGIFFGVSFHIGPLYSSPELALLVGNIFSYAVSPKYRLKLFLKEKKQLAVNLYEFVFSSSQKVSFLPGQYFEWTLPHAKADTRGVRRYFTIASSPVESDIRLGVRIEPARSSSFKTALMALSPGDSVMASSLAGEFVLPLDQKEKLAFIAGGIGVTPFRSMIAYLKDRNEKRDIVFFYANRTDDEIAYTELFASAAEVGIKMVYIVGEAKNPDWSGHTGFLTKDIIAKEAPDYSGRTFYISGSHGMVTAFEKLLSESGITPSRIHTDFFPGFA